MAEQSPPLKALHALPVELVRIIFEIAASQSRTSAANLVCVSKTVQQWIAPLLYQTIVIGTPPSLCSFYETVQISRSSFISHTRALYLPPGLPPPFLTNFPDLQHLAISSFSLRGQPLPLSHQPTAPRPTNITITGPLAHISFRHPIFQRCTHLYLTDDVPGPFAITAEGLPCLKYLACAYRHGTSSVTSFTCLPLLLAQNTSEHVHLYPDIDPSSSFYQTTPVQLKVLIVDMYLPNGSPDATMFVMERFGLGKTLPESQLLADPRLLPRPGRPLTPQRWESYVLSNAMWTTAEREIREQRQVDTLPP